MAFDAIFREQGVQFAEKYPFWCYIEAKIIIFPANLLGVLWFCTSHILNL